MNASKSKTLFVKALLYSALACPGAGHYVLGTKPRAYWLCGISLCSMTIWMTLITLETLANWPLTISFSTASNSDFYNAWLLQSQRTDILAPILCLITFSVLWFVAIIDIIKGQAKRQ